MCTRCAVPACGSSTACRTDISGVVPVRAAITDRRVEAIAGAPLATNSTPGSRITPGALAPFEDRTVYVVFDILNVAEAYDSIAQVGSGGGSGFIQMRTEAAGSSHVGARFDTKNGSANVTLIRAGARTFGRHTMWAQTRQSMSQIGLDIDRGPGLSGALIPGDGMETDTLYLRPVIAGVAPIFCALYRGAHDATTRARVLGWLAQRYQMPM